MNSNKLAPDKLAYVDHPKNHIYKDITEIMVVRLIEPRMVYNKDPTVNPQVMWIVEDIRTNMKYQFYENQLLEDDMDIKRKWQARRVLFGSES